VIVSRHRGRKAVAFVLAAVMLLIPVSPALADDPAPTARIATGVTVCGVAVGGMTADEASAAVAAGCTLPVLAPITLDATGSVFTFDPAPAVSLDTAGLLADALASTGPADFGRRYSVDTTAVADFVGSVATSMAIAPVSSKRTVVKKRLRITPARVGRALDVSATLAAVLATIDAELAADGAQQPAVTAPVVEVQPKYSPANIGKTILVVLHERYLYYYSGAKLMKKIRCAIGMPGHSTPTGKFKVVRKSARPSWRNPGSAWAARMPGYIRPGYYNPLGLRALYLNAPGIRIHGTAKTWSMGHAASHGCIRLTNATIVKLYPHIPVGTPVWIVK